MAAVVGALAVRPMEEMDLFFRLAAGEQILRTGHLVRENLFSFTYPRQAYSDR